MPGHLGTPNSNYYCIEIQLVIFPKIENQKKRGKQVITYQVLPTLKRPQFCKGAGGASYFSKDFSPPKKQA